ncbi:MAG: UDP-N-acetylmuramate dehydrogenase [Clostridia bacterium]|nr:UDP-N-acetylmuramate dehydrogenase [Clostridia bacterium]
MIDLYTFAKSLESDSCEILVDTPMSRHTSFKAGGNADVIALPKNVNSLTVTLKSAHKNNVPVTVMGNGSNLLVKDEGIRGIVIKTTGMDPEIEVDNEIIRCSAGTSLTKLCVAALENGLTGLEFAYGIPGTVGGAVFMNAGAYGGEIKDVLKTVQHITPEFDTESADASALNLGYRKSFYSEHPEYIIATAEFKLQKGDKAEIKAKMDDLIGRRKDKQPLEFPSAGSTFKRPEGYFAGALIEQCGLKGCRIGGAEVSEKHAGFIINRYSGTASDIIELIDHVKKTVKENTGVTLEPEVKIIP